MYTKTGEKTTIATSRTGALHWRADASEKNQGPRLRRTQLLRCLVPSCHKDLVFYCLAAWMCGPKLAAQTAEAVPNNFLMAPLMRWQQFKILGTNCDTVLGCVWLKVWYEWVRTLTVSQSHLTNFVTTEEGLTFSTHARNFLPLSTDSNATSFTHGD